MSCACFSAIGTYPLPRPLHAESLRGARAVGEPWASRGRAVGEPWASRGRAVGEPWVTPQDPRQRTQGAIAPDDSLQG